MNRAEIHSIFAKRGELHDLSYMSYCWHRKSRSAERLSRLFPQAEAFERRYREEILDGPKDAA